jgi:IS5 family transposase
MPNLRTKFLIVPRAAFGEKQKQGRDPEMHQTKKGNQWHFGMKAHIGVDVANEADISRTACLLHGREKAVFADGRTKAAELEDCDVSWKIAIKRSIIKPLPKALRDRAEAEAEQALSKIRAWVEHPFHIVKNLFRHKMLAIAAWPRTPRNCAPCSHLANLVIVQKTLLAQGCV